MKRKDFIILLAAVMTMGFSLNAGRAKAQDQGPPQGTNEELHDEGYGNDDAEYYNAEDDVANVDEPAESPDNSSTNAQ